MTPLAIGRIIRLEPSPKDALALVKDMGISSVEVIYQAGLDSREGVESIKHELAATGINISSILFGFVGNRYDDIATVRATVGIAPEATRIERLEHVQKVAKFASAFGVRRLVAHMGYVPEDAADPAYIGIVLAMRRVCDDITPYNQVIALETGQETAQGLRRFITAVDRPNLRVNLDPANMILYGSENPIEALDALIPFIDGVHCKDGSPSTAPGKLGKEMPLGKGDVGFERWLSRLIALGYRGTLTIERETDGEQQRRDILAAKDLIESITRTVTAAR